MYSYLHINISLCRNALNLNVYFLPDTVNEFSLIIVQLFFNFNVNEFSLKSCFSIFNLHTI